MVELTCFGGVDEIGGNKLLLDFSKGSIFLDFGQSFKKEGEFFEEFLQPRSKSAYYDLTLLDCLPRKNGIYRKDVFCPEGIESCIYDVGNYWESPLKSYEDAKDEKEWIPDAVFISHAHLDHCGYIGFLGNMPLYCSKHTQGLIKSIHDIGNLSGFEKEIIEIKRRVFKKRKSGFFPGAQYIDTDKEISRKFETLENSESMETENEISITGFDVGHSVPGSMACLIESDGFQILYTGDIRFHGRYQPDLSTLYGLKPDLMISEGTNIQETEPDDEQLVLEQIQDHIMRTEELVMIGFAWKDIERYETIRNAAIAEGRTPVFDPRLAYTLARLGRDIYSEGASVFVERCESMIYSPDDYTTKKHKAGCLDYDEWSSKKDNIVTDYTHLKKGVTALDLQTDPNSYVLQLDYFRFKNILDINPNPGSVYIRAQCEPFNKRMELSEERLENWLKFFKINQDNDNKPHQCHASGHACGPEILSFIENIKPKKVVPIHTEKPQIFKSSTSNVIIPVKNISISF